MENNTTVLSIDDNLQNRRVIELSLKDHFNVISSDGNRPIVELVEETNPKIILLDVMLEGKTGFDLCSQLRASDEGEDAFVIFVSALTSEQDKLTAYASGGDDYICKPIDVKELLQKLKAVEKRINDKNQLVNQCSHASKVAFTSMKQASELGSLINFFNDSIEISSTDELFILINDFFEQIEIKHSVEFRIENKYLHNTTNMISPLELEVLELGRSAQRIVNFGNNILLNSKWCSILVKHLPTDDEDFVGRIRDNIAILLSIIDSRLMLIDSESKRISERKKALKSLSNSIGVEFSDIKNALLSQETKLLSLLSELTINLEQKNISLVLNEEQESELRDFFDDTKDKFFDAIGTSVSIDNKLDKINRLLIEIS